MLRAGLSGAVLFAPASVGSAGLPGVPQRGVPSAYDVYDVKAAVLYKLAKFIEWPDEAFRDAPALHTFCVVGRGPMGPALERAMAGKTLGGRRVAVRRGLRADELDPCQVVFLHGSDPRQLGPVLASLGSRPVLLIGESSCFTLRGGMINLVVEDRRVVFEIHPRRAAEAHLRIHPNLLSLARIVESKADCDPHAAPA